MTKANLIKSLQGLDDQAEILIVDSEQEHAWNIIEVRTTDGNTTYADLVIG